MSMMITTIQEEKNIKREDIKCECFNQTKKGGVRFLPPVNHDGYIMALIRQSMI